MKQAAFLIPIAVASCLSAHAAVIDLKCLMKSDKDGSTYESWVAIDTSINAMRINGDALPLTMTNEAYASTQRGVAGFVTVRRIDRQTGAMVTTMIYEGQPSPMSSGTCEKATPPTAKF